MSGTLLVRLDEYEPSQQAPSKFGGKPVLYEGHQPNPYCDSCRAQLTFIGQVSSPLDTAQTYHRSLYIYGCTACAFEARAYRAQTSTKTPALKQAQGPYLAEQYGVTVEQIDRYPVYDLQQLESESDEQAEEGEPEEVAAEGQAQDYDKMAKEMPKRDPAVDKFIYVMGEMGNPQAIFCGPPLTVKRELAREPRCLYCGGATGHELQLNPSLLAGFKALINLNWGVLSVYTCKASCGANVVRQQCVVLQDQQGNLKKQTKAKKNKRRKGKEGKQQGKGELEGKDREAESKKQQQKGKREECDWD